MINVRNQMGYWLAALTAGLTVLSFALAIFGTPSYTFSYPYSPDIIPADFVWLIPAFVLMAAFVALTATIHQQSPDEKKVFSQIALSFAIICAVLLMTDFFVQWTVIMPSTSSGETAGLPLFTEYNPHGLFVSVESLGYLMMSTAFLFLAPLFETGRLQRAIRWLFVAGFILAVCSFIGIMLAGLDIVQFEVIVIFIDWTVLTVSGILLAVLFRRSPELWKTYSPSKVDAPV